MTMKNEVKRKLGIRRMKSKREEEGRKNPRWKRKEETMKKPGRQSRTHPRKERRKGEGGRKQRYG